MSQRNLIACPSLLVIIVIAVLVHLGLHSPDIASAPLRFHQSQPPSDLGVRLCLSKQLGWHVLVAAVALCAAQPSDLIHAAHGQASLPHLSPPTIARARMACPWLHHAWHKCCSSSLREQAQGPGQARLAQDQASIGLHAGGLFDQVPRTQLRQLQLFDFCAGSLLVLAEGTAVVALPKRELSSHPSASEAPEASLSLSRPNLSPLKQVLTQDTPLGSIM